MAKKKKAAKKRAKPKKKIARKPKKKIARRPKYKMPPLGKRGYLPKRAKSKTGPSPRQNAKKRRKPRVGRDDKVFSSHTSVSKDLREW